MGHSNGGHCCVNYCGTDHEKKWCAIGVRKLKKNIAGVTPAVPAQPNDTHGEFQQIFSCSSKPCACLANGENPRFGLNSSATPGATAIHLSDIAIIQRARLSRGCEDRLRDFDRAVISVYCLLQPYCLQVHAAHEKLPGDLSRVPFRSSKQGRQNRRNPSSAQQSPRLWSLSRVCNDR